MTVILTLGAVVFQGFEVPESIQIGGEHALIVHKLPGGGRIIDAMGPDDRDIPWSGRFRGYQAESRARQLDGYRKAGTPLELTWSTYRFQVIVRSFEANYQQPFEIPYSINCLVVTDEGSPILPDGQGIDQSFGSDLAAAVTLGGAINMNSISSAIATVQAARAAVATLKNANASSISSIFNSITAAQAATNSVTVQVEGTMAAAGVFAPGTPPGALVSSLTTQATGFGQLSNLYQMGSTLSRMGKNLGSGS